MEELSPIETEIQGKILDVKPDFYGKIIAVASSDGKISIYQNSESNYQLISQFLAHEGPVLQVDFSHPRFGSLLASCGFDGKAYLWKETNYNFEKIYAYVENNFSINCISFSNGSKDELIFATGDINGNIVIHQSKGDNFSTKRLVAHDFGVNSIDFNSDDPYEFVSGGNDGLIKVWKYSHENDNWEVTSTIDDIECPVNDIAYKKGENCFACVVEDGNVFICKFLEGKWNKKEVKSLEEPGIKVSWDDNGNSFVVVGNNGEHILIDDNEIAE